MRSFGKLMVTIGRGSVRRSPRGRRFAIAGAMAMAVLAAAASMGHAQQGLRGAIPPVPKPFQRDRPAFKAQLIKASQFIRVVEARDSFGVDGRGLAAAVLDTGLNLDHVDFAGAGRIPARRNFTTDDGGDPDKVTDGNGHGSNVGGIVVAHGDHTGIAPGANIVPLKVLNNDGSGDFDAIQNALDWVIAHHSEFNITVVNLSLGGSNNFADDTTFAMDPIRDKIRQLRDLKVATVIAAGNDWFRFNPRSGGGSVRQGMSFPGICREAISVGAVYDQPLTGPITYVDGASTNLITPGRITPFSQRLHFTVNMTNRTDVFAPGAPVTSSGNSGPHGESVEHGTSQASPVTAGVVLLLQAFYEKVKGPGQRPSVDDLEIWLSRGPATVTDVDDGQDNVLHTGLPFPRLDALSSLQSASTQLLEVEPLQAKGLLRKDDSRQAPR
jgi:subtilisin family serine protease